MMTFVIIDNDYCSALIMNVLCSRME